MPSRPRPARRTRDRRRRRPRRTPSPTPPASPPTCRSTSHPGCRSTSTSSTARACSAPCSPTRAGASASATRSGESRCCRCSSSCSPCTPSSSCSCATATVCSTSESCVRRTSKIHPNLHLCFVQQPVNRVRAMCLFVCLFGRADGVGAAWAGARLRAGELRPRRPRVALRRQEPRPPRLPAEGPPRDLHQLRPAAADAPRARRRHARRRRVGAAETGREDEAGRRRRHRRRLPEIPAGEGSGSSRSNGEVLMPEEQTALVYMDTFACGKTNSCKNKNFLQRIYPLPQVHTIECVWSMDYVSPNL